MAWGGVAGMVGFLIEAGEMRRQLKAIACLPEPAPIKLNKLSPELAKQINLSCGKLANSCG